MLKYSLNFILITFTALGASAGTLKTVIGENMAPPWYFANPGFEGEGIIPDYLRALEKKLKFKVEILVLPKFRIRDYYEKNLIDFNCYTTPEWAGPASANFDWSQKLFDISNMIVTNNGAIKSLDDLNGQRIGTVLKYSYPTLQKHFDAKKFLRDDSTNEQANLNKLESERYKYAVVDNHHLGYYLRKNPGSKISPVGFIVEEISVRCWVRKGSELKLAELNKAISEMKKDGTLTKIFQRYK